MSNKFLAVVKLNTGEEVIAKIESSPELDAISLDCPAMVGQSAFSRKPGLSIIKIEPWIKTDRWKRNETITNPTNSYSCFTYCR